MDRLAESFLERFRRGERPSITEYIANNPDHASDIQELFPALVEIEQLKSADATDSIFLRQRRPQAFPAGHIRERQELGTSGSVTHTNPKRYDESRPWPVHCCDP